LAVDSERVGHTLAGPACFYETFRQIDACTWDRGRGRREMRRTPPQPAGLALVTLCSPADLPPRAARGDKQRYSASAPENSTSSFVSGARLNLPAAVSAMAASCRQAVALTTFDLIGADGSAPQGCGVASRGLQIRTNTIAGSDWDC
jgi:hypothetical protein